MKSDEMMAHKRRGTPGELIDCEILDIRGVQQNQGSSPWLEYLVVRLDDRSVLVKTSAIDWIEAAGNYVRVHRGKESSLVRKSIGKIQVELNPRMFIRIHRSAMVNIDRIRELQRMFHGEYRLILINGINLTLSRHYLKNFQDIVGGTL